MEDFYLEELEPGRWQPREETRRIYCNGVRIGWHLRDSGREPKEEVFAVNGDPEIQAKLDAWLEEKILSDRYQRESMWRRQEQESRDRMRREQDEARKALGLGDNEGLSRMSTDKTGKPLAHPVIMSYL